MQEKFGSDKTSPFSEPVMANVPLVCTYGSVNNNQGRIQDLRLGVAQKNWKLKKKGGGEGGGDISNISIYISITIFFKYDFYYNNVYLKPPYTILYWKKKLFEKF